MLASVSEHGTALDCASECGTVVYSTIERGTVLDSAGKCDIDAIGVINYYIKI